MSKVNEIEEMQKLQKQNMEYIAFSGGGAKGAGYSGVHAALVDSGTMEGVKAVSGSSAGSIAAAVIASGISKEAYQALSANTNMKALLGKGFVINKDGEPLLQLVADTIRNNVTEYFNQIDINIVLEQRLQQVIEQKEELATNPGKISKEELEVKNQELQNQLDRLLKISDLEAREFIDLKNKSNDSKEYITFKDLDLLNLLNPQKFKGLIVTATKQANGELTIFDAKHSPDIPIAQAVRASSGFPVVFKPFEINGAKYVDGGYRDNIPIKYFNGEEFKKEQAPAVEDISNDKQKIKESRNNGRTMAFAFGGGDMNSSANVAVYSAKEKIVDPGKIMSFIMNVVVKAIVRVGGKFKYTEEENKVHERLRENALNTVILDTGKVDTLSFDQAQKSAGYLHSKGYLQTMEYMNNHELGTKMDPNLSHKAFIVEIYEGLSKSRSWSNKFKEEKMQDILDLSREEIWKEKGSKDILSDLVVHASTRRTDGKLRLDTNTMTNLVEKLNSPKTSDKVKQDFVELLGIDAKKSENLVKFKFAPKDFEPFLNQQKANDKDKTQNFADKYRKKEGSKAEIIKQEALNPQEIKTSR